VEAIDHLPNCCAKMSKYIKLAKIVVVQVSGYVEDECCFNSLNIMKKKLRKRLTMHLDVIIWMFAQKSYTLEIFPYDCTSGRLPIANMQLMFTYFSLTLGNNIFILQLG